MLKIIKNSRGDKQNLFILIFTTLLLLFNFNVNKSINAQYDVNKIFLKYIYSIKVNNIIHQLKFIPFFFFISKHALDTNKTVSCSRGKFRKCIISQMNQSHQKGKMVNG